ncbi:MAG: BamA/TamA family outer membrane protein [Candidatus Zixiibacteriota bacterium]|nr:MAG: BamA/TamA family outer membrane protein [candidate division Zixibacteria bacterium]
MTRLVPVLLATLFALGQVPAGAAPMDKALLRWMRDKPIIDSIHIGGNEYFSASRIKRQMYSRERGVWGAIKGDRRTRLQYETYDRDTLEIKFLYLTNGFLGIRVHQTFEPLGTDSTALIRVNIAEGRQYLYGKKSVLGTFEDRFIGGFYRAYVKLEEGKPVSIFQLRQAVFDMKTVLANNGYPYARVTYALDTVTAPPIADVSFHIDPDSLVLFGEVGLQGLDEYPDYVALRELKIKPDAVYRRQTIIDSRKRLFESGYFSYLRLDRAANGGDSLRPDFLLSVRERKPYYVSVTTGAGQSEFRDLQWDFSFGIGKRNLFGSRRISFGPDYSFGFGEEIRLIQHRYRLRYTEPWFLGIRMPLSITGEYEPPIKFTPQDFKIESWSATVSTLRWFGDEIKTTAGWEYNTVRISGVPEGSEDSLRQAEGISARRKLYAGFRMDSRDNIFIPRRGALADISAEYVGGFLGGDDDYYKIEAGWSTYQVVWPGWILAIRLKGGYVTEFGDSDEVPKEELLYLGGANTIRGFKENTLGPLRADSTVEGACITLIFNQEFRWKTVQVLKPLPVIGTFFESLPLYQSVFFDVGNGFRNDREIAVNNLAVSYGSGIQLMSPAGPIRVDYARRVKTPNYDFDTRWHFTILYAF